MTGERTMGPVDTMWLNMDRPNNLMVIDSVMWFDGPVDWDRWTDVITRRLVDRYPVFRQRPVPARTPLGMPHWEDDPDFEVGRHVTRVRLDAPGDQAALERFIEGLMPKPLPRDRPLWHTYLVDGFGDGCAVVSRFHHSLADGIALAQVLLSLTDDGPDGDLDEVPAPASERTAAPESRSSAPNGAGALAGAASVATSAAGGAAALAGSLAHAVTGTVSGTVSGGLHLLSELPHLASPDGVRDAVSLVTDTAQIADKLLVNHNPRTPLTGKPGPAKRAAWCPPRRLDEVKRIARLSGGTVNDVMVAAVSGAIHEYIKAHGGTPADLTTMVPVNVRPVDKPLPRELGNEFALVLLPLPTGAASPVERLAEAKHRMDHIKHSPEAVLTFGLISAIGFTTPEMEKLLVDFFTAKAIGVTTNVPGPTRPRYLAGTRIAGTLAWVPASGDHTIGVSIFSYDGQVLVGFKTDATVVPDIEQLVALFGAEMDRLEGMVHAA